MVITMIKRTFYNLPAEKREKIIDITRKEFQKGNKRKITINTVIKKAGISRGSFYQYFDDKLDLVELVTDDMIEKMLGFVRDELMLNGGDIFALPLRIFDVMTVDQFETSDIRDYADMITLADNENQNRDLISDYMQYRSRKPDFIGRLDKYIDRSKLAYSSDKDIEYVVFLMFDVLKLAMSNVIKGGSVESERAALGRKIEIIRNGAAV